MVENYCSDKPWNRPRLHAAFSIFLCSPLHTVPHSSFFTQFSPKSIAHLSSLNQILWSMWSFWLAFCGCGFHSVCPLIDEDKRLVQASWWEGLAVGEPGSCSGGQGCAQFSSVQPLSHIQLSATPWSATHQASLIHHQHSELFHTYVHQMGDVTSSCHPLLLLPLIIPSIRVFF